jgi:hypothetical protein
MMSGVRRCSKMCYEVRESEIAMQPEFMFACCDEWNLECSAKTARSLMAVRGDVSKIGVAQNKEKSGTKNTSEFANET